MQILGRYRPLLMQEESLYASLGLTVFRSHDFGESFCRLASCREDLLQALGSRLPMGERIGRLGFDSLLALPGERLIGTIRGSVVLSEASLPFRSVFRMTRGSRPLNLCLSPEGQVFFGEYFSNPERTEVHIYGTSDCQSWEIVWTFSAGSVRHIHAVIYDPYRDGVWVLTGDRDHECGLWFTPDSFTTLEPVARGSQHFRAVAVVPMEEGLLVPTDSPKIQNWIQLLEFPDLGFRRLHPLPGSAFHAIRSGGVFFVSTVSEPSTVNSQHGARVYGSLDGFRWGSVARFSPDLLSRGFSWAARLIRYPEIAMVGGWDQTPFVFGYGRGVAGAGGKMIRWDRRSILETLREGRLGERKSKEESGPEQELWIRSLLRHSNCAMRSGESA